MSNPADLNIVPQPDTDKNFFNFKAVGLKIDKSYSFKFQWIYDDLTLSEWSPGYRLNTSTEIIPSSPNVAVPSNGTGSIPVTLSVFPINARRVDVYVINGIFGTGKVAYSFSSAGTTTIAAPAGTYQVQLITVTPSGINGTPSETFTITIEDVGETIQSPTNPNGFSSKRILAGIEVSWAGTYADGTFTGFEAINIYAGNSSSATAGTFEQVGVLTGNNLKNTIVIPLGAYVSYGQAVYIHAAAVNKNGSVGAIQSNVTNQALGPGRASDADINDGAVVISKLASDVLTVGNLKAGDINATSFIRAGTAGSARVELSSADIASGPSAGFYIYNSAGTPILSAPLTGGLSINGGGTFSGNLSAAGGTFAGTLSAASGSFSGTVSASSGSIGNWVINSGKIASSAGTSPTIELDPLTPQIVIRGTGGQAGFNLTLAPVTGITAGSTFSVTPSGLLTSTNASIGGWSVNANAIQKTVGGNTIILDSSSLRAVGSSASVIIGYDGTISATNNSGSGGSYSLPSIKVSSSDGYASLNPGSVLMHQNSIFDSVEFDFYQYVYNNTLNFSVTGGGIAWANYYITQGVSTYTTAQIRTAVSGGNHDFRPLGLSPDGGQWTGPRLYYGSSTTNAAINSELSGGYGGSSQNGDFYFSTA